MLGQLLPLRLLGYSTSFLPPSSFPMLRRAFPFKLKYFTLPPVSRPISSRPSRANLRVAAADGGKGRSLVDDETELSDWVSDLKPDFFCNQLEKGSDVVEDSNGGRRRFESGGVSKRRRGSESGGRDASSFRQSKKISKFLIDSDLDDENDDDGDECYSGGRQRGGGKGAQVRSSSSVTRRGGKDFNFDRQAMPHDSRGSPISFPSARREQRGSGGRKGIDNSRKDAFGMWKVESEDDNDGNDIGRQSGRRSVEHDHRRGSHMVKRGQKVAALGTVDRRKAAFQISEEDEDEDEDGFEVESATEDDLISTDEDGKEVIGISSSFHRVEDENIAKPNSGSAFVKSDSYLSETRFDQCSLSPLSLKGLRAAGFERMTLVQEATLPIILEGKDVLAKARTGTGKTVAFLLPAIEIVLKQTPIDRDSRRPPIYVLIICPTRELANQASMEANTLLKFHPNIGVQFVTGGTRLALEQKRIQANPCQILVATPGRLRDHTENTPGFASRLMGVKVLVLDEADHLLDMGFRKDIEKIISAVPKQRQTLLFSATVPEEVRQVCHIALRRDHEFINTVEEGSEETHSQVEQMLMVAPLGVHFSLLYHILQEHIADDVDYKVLVFCTTAMVTRLVAEILSELKLNVREIHSRKPQSYRTRVSDEFRKSKGLILVTSDVSARGVDYPDVTLVIQVGVPSDREQYIHRLGRTGRKGKEGQGILMLAPWEDYFVSTVKDLPISKASLPQIDPETRMKVERALAHVEMKNKEAAYQAWLGYYNSNKKVGRDKHKLVELANEFSRSMGLDNPPAIPKLVLGKMGLRNIPGLRSK